VRWHPSCSVPFRFVASHVGTWGLHAIPLVMHIHSLDPSIYLSSSPFDLFFSPSLLPSVSLSLGKHTSIPSTPTPSKPLQSSSAQRDYLISQSKLFHPQASLQRCAHTTAMAGCSRPADRTHPTPTLLSSSSSQRIGKPSTSGLRASCALLQCGSGKTNTDALPFPKAVCCPGCSHLPPHPPTSAPPSPLLVPPDEDAVDS